MYTEFAYSLQMQIILAVIALVQTFIYLYLVADIALRIHRERARGVQKALYACLTGTLLHNIWVYGLYFILGSRDFTSLAYLLFTTPNPLTAVLYYIFGVKALKLPPLRSFAFMGKLYMLNMFIRSVNRLIGSIFLYYFPQPPGAYNYLLNAHVQLICLVVFVLFYAAIRAMQANGVIRARNAGYSVFTDTKREWREYILKAVLLYAAYVSIPYFIADSQAIFANSLLAVMLALFFALVVYGEYYRAMVVDLSNRDAYIKALAVSLAKSNGMRHDLRNILNTYGGYLELGMLERLKEYHASITSKLLPLITLDLSGRLGENPALVSLLNAKAAYAQNQGVAFRLNIDCALDDLFINNLDLCRIVGNLADNAIEAAAESDLKSVCITINAKNADDKLIVITNSTKGHVDVERIQLPGETTKAGHSGIGLPTVRAIISEYGNSVFRITYFDYEFVAYLELRRG